jgi:hypothetical protein
LASGHQALDWGCSQCRGEDYAEGDQFRAARGCEKPNESLGFEFAPSLRRCPWSQLDAEVNLLLGWYREWKAYGVLPYGETNLLDEPAFVLEAIDTISTEIDGMKAERQRRAQAEHDAAMKKARRR